MPKVRYEFAMLIKIALVVFGGIFAVSYITDLVDRGALPHKENIKLSMAGNWLDNESRTCLSGYVFYKDRGVYIAETMACPIEAYAETQHDIPITFYGNVERQHIHDSAFNGTTYIGNSHWRCVKQSGGFSCYALD